MWCFTSFLKIWLPKYFEYTYGIDAPKNLKTLVEKGYAGIETSFDSLDHLNATMKKNILKSKGITVLSKMKIADLDQSLHNHFSEEELASFFSIRGYKLTPKGERILEQYQDIVDRHPKKKSLIKWFFGWFSLKLPYH